MLEIGNDSAASSVSSVQNVENTQKSGFQTKVDLSDPVDSFEFTIKKIVEDTGERLVENAGKNKAATIKEFVENAGEKKISTLKKFVENVGKNKAATIKEFVENAGEKKVSTCKKLVENAGNKKISTCKKVGVGIASAFLPGLGQVINGQVGKGIGYCAGTIVAGLLLGPIGVAAVGIASIVDAVKNVKS